MKLVMCTESGCCGLQAELVSHVQGVEEVSTQNTVLNAKAVLKGLVKCTDHAVIQEVEVVAAKYDLATGGGEGGEEGVVLRQVPSTTSEGKHPSDLLSALNFHRPQRHCFSNPGEIREFLR